MGFSVLVEMLNLRLRPATEPVHLHRQFEDEAAEIAESAGK
jgi:hypothetical protein